MQAHQFRKHPLHIAAILLLTGYAQAQDLSINSMTLDTASGKSLGNISKRGEMMNFFQVQKEMVFNTLSHLGVKLEDLPPKLRQEIEKPQTTNAQAFAAFAKAVDKADKGQFAQAAQLFKQAAKLDPAFGLAKGMAVLMPKFDLAPGDAKKVLADLKKDAKDDGKKQGEKLAGDVDKKEKDLKSDGKGDKTKDKLAKLADGEDGDKKDKDEKQSEVKKKLDKLGLSDEGDDTGFDPNEAEEDPNKIETASIGGGGSMDPLLLASSLNQSLSGPGDPIFQVFPDFSVGDRSNEDRQRQEAEALAKPFIQTEAGVLGGIVDGRFVGGSATLNVTSAESGVTASVAFIREGGSPENLVFIFDESGESAEFQGAELFGLSGIFYAELNAYSEDAYLIQLSQEYPGQQGNLSSLAVNDAQGRMKLLMVTGTPTPSGALPVSGVQSVNLNGLITDSTESLGYGEFSFGGLVDWRTNKVFSPVTMREQGDGVLVLGGVNRTKSSLEAGVWWLDGYEPDVGFVSGQSDDIDIPLYGSTHPVLGGSLFSTEERNLSGQLLRRNEGIIVAKDFASAPSAARTPADGETWTGFSAGVGQWSDNGYFTYLGDSRFTFTPSKGDVVGEVGVEGYYSFFATSADDPNAFINKDAFGAKTTNDFGTPSYFSTQGDFTGAGWTDLVYTSMGYWAHDDNAEGHVRFLDYSTWVAGSLSPTAVLDALHLQQGSASYAGKVLGAITVSGSYGSSVDLLTGDFNMQMDFGARTLSGALTNLRKDSDGSLWLSRADFTGGSQGDGYSAYFLEGNDIVTESSYLSGAFYGPQAEETGGAWRIVRSYSGYDNYEDAAGVFTGKQGNLFYSLPAKWVGIINGGFEVGSAVMNVSDPNSLVPDFILSLQREGYSDGDITYSKNQYDYYDLLTRQLWDGTSGKDGAWGSIQANGTDAYFARYNQYSGDSISLTAFGGNRAAQSDLPASGQYHYYVSLLAQGVDSDTDISGSLGVNFDNNRVFMPAQVTPWQKGSPLVFGTLDKATATINVQVADKENWYGDFTGNWGWSLSSATMDMYGTNTGNQIGGRVAGGLLDGTIRDTGGAPLQNAVGAISGYNSNWNRYTSPVLPAENQVWSGYTANLLVDRGTGIFRNSDGSIDIHFKPSAGQVTGSMSDSWIEYGVSTSADDPNAFLGTNGFGAMHVQANDAGLTYFSTRSLDTWWESIPSDAMDAYLGNLNYHYVGSWSDDHGSYTVLPASYWVAGALTPNVDLPTSGYVRYSGYVSGVMVASDQRQYEYVTGLYDMTVDFSPDRRDFTGAITNLLAYNQYGQSGAPLANGFDFSGALDAYGGSLFNSSHFSGSENLVGAGVEGAFNGFNREENGVTYYDAAREVGGRWWMSLDNGSTLGGIFSATDQKQMDWSSGVLADMADAGTLAIENALAARVSHYYYVDDVQRLYGEFVAPGYLGRFQTTDIANRTPIAGRPYFQAAWDASSDTYVNGYGDFKTDQSYVQYTADDDFYRFFLADTSGLRGVEGYYGRRTSWGGMPWGGISTYDFHQSAIENGAGNSSALTGQDGIFPGRLYVNWDTGAVFGYNADPAVEGGGRAMFLGRVNRQTRKRTLRQRGDPQRSGRGVQNVAARRGSGPGGPCRSGAHFRSAQQYRGGAARQRTPGGRGLERLRRRLRGRPRYRQRGCLRQFHGTGCGDHFPSGIGARGRSCRSRPEHGERPARRQHLGCVHRFQQRSADRGRTSGWRQPGQCQHLRESQGLRHDPEVAHQRRRGHHRVHRGGAGSL